MYLGPFKQVLACGRGLKEGRLWKIRQGLLSALWCSTQPAFNHQIKRRPFSATSEWTAEKAERHKELWSPIVAPSTDFSAQEAHALSLTREDIESITQYRRPHTLHLPFLPCQGFPSRVPDVLGVCVVHLAIWESGLSTKLINLR